MISLPRKARPRRSPNRVRLVEADGSPARPSAESWPASTDNWFWGTTDRVIGTDSMGADVHESDCVPEPDDDARRDGAALWAEMMIEASLPAVSMPGIDLEPESEAAFFARLASEEEHEKARVLATYQPSPTDLAEYSAWSEALDNGTLPPSAAGRFAFSPLPPVRESCHTIAEWDAIRSGQISEDELAMLAAGMAI